MARLTGAVIGFGLLGFVPAFGQFTPISTPTPAYTGGTTILAITGADLTPAPSLTDGTQTATFSTGLQARTVPGTWATWGSPPNTEGATPRVVTEITGAVTTLTITLSASTNTFGFEFEPNAGTQSISAAFMDGATTLGTVTRTVAGTSGALLFAASSTTPITSVVLTVPAGAGGFALARLRYEGVPAPAVPLPSTLILCGVGILLLAARGLLERRQSTPA